MAFDIVRFSTYNTGQTGAGMIAKYDGSGSTAEGGDTLATIKAEGFFTDAVVVFVRQAEDGRSQPRGLPALLHGNDGLEWSLININPANGRVREGGGNWEIS